MPSGLLRIDELPLRVWLGLTDTTSKLGRSPATHGAGIPVCACAASPIINPKPALAINAFIGTAFLHSTT
jgi:hypothetical protein